MTSKELYAVKISTKERVEKETIRLQTRYRKMIDEYIAEHCDMQLKTVYERKVPPTKRFKFSRFIPYVIDILWFDENPMIRVAGWWLDTDNIPARWDTLPRHGVSNPLPMERSLNQKYLPHPDSKEAKKQTA